MATLQQVHLTLQDLHQKTGGDPIHVEAIAELLGKTPESVYKQVTLLTDLKFTKVTSDGQYVWLTETGLLAQVEQHVFSSQS
jgi:Mn-dependent DtxR family transcriptional regulator